MLVDERDTAFSQGGCTNVLNKNCGPEDIADYFRKLRNFFHINYLCNYLFAVKIVTFEALETPN